MTAPLRAPLDAWVDTIAPCVATAQSMTSPIFASLPTALSATYYVPAEVVDEISGARETIRIVGADGSTTATVIRGVEGTSPITWDQPATIRCGPAPYDLLQVVPRIGDLPTDLHVGARVLAVEESLVREQTQRQGALPTVRASVKDMPASLAGLNQHFRDEHMRVKAIQFGPIITNAAGECRVMWDAPTNLSYQQNTLVDGLPLRYIAYVRAEGYLASSDASWGGSMAVNFMTGPPWWVQILAFWPGSRTPFANRQVAGSLLVVGA